MTTSSLTLASVNEGIVSLRGPVTQARVHVIHRLTRQIEKFRSKKGSDSQKNKNERKAKRFLEEVKILKETSKDELARFCLRSKRKLEQIVNKSDDLKMRAFVRVSNHPSVHKVVLRFRQKHPTWEKDIQSLLDRLGRVQKKKSPGIVKKKAEKLKEKKKELYEKHRNKNRENKGESDDDNAESDCDQGEESKEEECLARKTLDEIEDQSDDDDEEEEIQLSKAHNFGTNSQELSRENSDSDSSEKAFVSSLRDIINRKPNKNSEETDDSKSEEDEGDLKSEEDEGDLKSDKDEDDLESNDEDSSESEDDEGSQESKGPEKKIFKKEGTMEIRTLDLKSMENDEDEDHNQNELTDGEQKASTSPLVTEEKKMPKDSFFLGGKSSDDEEDEGDKGDEDDKEEDDSKFDDFKLKKEKKISMFNRADRRAQSHGRGHSRGRGRGDFRGRGRSRGRGGFRRSEDQVETSHLHPSWAAKRNAQKSGLGQFRGKKRRFDDAGESVQVNEKKQDQKPSLHPSWEARKKNKVQIESFKGKKIVFDE